MRTRRWIVALATLILACIGFAGPGLRVARAHALLDRSFPEQNAELEIPPRSIELWFSEPLESGFSNIRLVDSSGADVNIGPSVVDSDDATHMSTNLSHLDPGIYTVVWRSLSKIDGHEWLGSFPFTILNPDGSRPSGASISLPGASRGELPTPHEALWRWMSILGGAVLFGVSLFILYVILRAARRSEEFQENELGNEAIRIAFLAIWIAAIAVLLGSWLGIAYQAGRLGGLSQIPNLLLGTRSGTLIPARTVLAFSALLIALTLPQPKPIAGRETYLLWLAGIGYLGATLLLAARILRGEVVLASAFSACAVLGLALVAWSRGGEADGAAVQKRTWQSLLLISTPLLLSFSLGSHAGGAEGGVWAVLVDFLHLVAASAWVGGLVLLPLLVRHSRRVMNPGGRKDLQKVVRRFSVLATLAVFVLVTTGLFNSLVELPDLQSLFTTAYGRVLLIKLFLVGLALGIAFLNNRLVQRRESELVESGGQRRFQRQVTIEASMSLGIFLVVAVLVQTPPPQSLARPAQPVQLSLPYNTLVEAGDLYVHVKVTPNQVGENDLWVHLYHSDGSSIGDVQLVRLSFDYAEAQLGQSLLNLAPSGLDVFEGSGSNLSQAGAWNVSVYIRRRGLDDVLGNLSLDVKPAAGESVPINPWGNPLPGFPPLVVTGGALLALGLFLLIWRRYGEPGGRPLPLTVAGDLAVFLGLTMMIGGGVTLIYQNQISPKPVPATAESIVAGGQLYAKECVLCHGESGLGDGPMAVTLQPPPAVLQTHVPLHPDAELYGFIENGFPGTAMPAFGTRLSPEDIWNLVNYLRDRFGELQVDSAS